MNDRRSIIGQQRFILWLTASCCLIFAAQSANAQTPASESFRHAKPAATKAGASLKRTRPGSVSASVLKPEGSSDSGVRTRYPDDLQYHGGEVVDSVESHNIYLKTSACSSIAACWGDPDTFLKDLGDSDLIHTVDEYVGLHRDNRYTFGGRKVIPFTTPKKPLTDDDIQAIVQTVAAATGETGYRHIYHVFLSPGTDECFDATSGECYSPDNPDTFFFCAYHGSFDAGIGHLLYSVEPYQNVDGCQVKPGTPNGQRIDSQNDTLSHELIEAITDPDGDAWWNDKNLVAFGQEIADECIFLTSDFFSDPNPLKVNGRKYVAQPEYSNQQRGCVSGS